MNEELETGPSFEEVLVKTVNEDNQWFLFWLATEWLMFNIGHFICEVLGYFSFVFFMVLSWFRISDNFQRSIAPMLPCIQTNINGQASMLKLRSIGRKMKIAKLISEDGGDSIVISGISDLPKPLIDMLQNKNVKISHLVMDESGDSEPSSKLNRLKRGTNFLE